MLARNKLADQVRPVLAEAGLLVRATLILSGVALVIACVALLIVVRRAHAS